VANRIPTVQEYQNCNYESMAAFSSAFRVCQAELKHVTDFMMGDYALHLAMFGDWKKAGWRFVQEYVELAQKLRAIREDVQT